MSDFMVLGALVGISGVASVSVLDWKSYMTHWACRIIFPDAADWARFFFKSLLHFFCSGIIICLE